MKASRTVGKKVMLGILFALLSAPLTGTAVQADAPALIPVKGFLTDADGVPIDGEHRLDFFLYAAATDGEDLYNTTYLGVDIDNGNFVIYLGEQEGDELDLALFRDTSDLWLEIVIDGDQIIAPRTRLATVPYAGYSQACDDATTVGGYEPTAFASASHTHVWSELVSGVPNGLADGDTVLDESQVEQYVTDDAITFKGDVTVNQTLVTGCEFVTCTGGDWVDCSCPSGKYIQAGGCISNASPFYYRTSRPISLTAWQCGGHGGNKEISLICCRQR